MFNGSLIDDLFAVVRTAEKSARPALPEETHPRGPSNEPLADRSDRRDVRGDFRDRRGDVRDFRQDRREARHN